MKLSCLNFPLDHNSATALFVQVYEGIREAIHSGKLNQGELLPASRKLALELRLSRSTVVNAYEQLVAEGYIEGRKGSGFYISPTGQGTLLSSRKPLQSSNPLQVSSISESNSSHPGFPDNRLFPFTSWARCLARAARLHPQTLMQTPKPFGDESLRRSVAQYLSDWRGLDISPEQVLITAGSIDALEIGIKTLANVGDTIALENPGYAQMKNIAINQGLKVRWMPVGKNGAEVKSLHSQAQPCKMIMLTPSHQFPLGGAMPAHRRLEFLAWANDNQAWILEDDYDGEFRYAGRPIPAMASLDSAARSIYIGSFSKVFAVGLRLGFLIMPPALIEQFGATLSLYGIKAATALQPALADFIDSGEFYRHIRRVKRIYAQRRKLLLEQIQLHLSDYVTYQDHQAGMQIALLLKSGLDDSKIVTGAKDKGLLVLALSKSYHAGKAQQGLLLGFCHQTEAEIIRTAMVLSEVISKQC